MPTLSPVDAALLGREAPDKLYIGGAWRTAAGTLPLVNPATGKPFLEPNSGRVLSSPAASRADVEAAVAAARAAFTRANTWSGLSGSTRAGLLDDIAAEVRGRRDRL